LSISSQDPLAPARQPAKLRLIKIAKLTKKNCIAKVAELSLLKLKLFGHSCQADFHKVMLKSPLAHFVRVNKSNFAYARQGQTGADRGR